MLVTRGSEYAIHSLIYLAKNGAAKIVLSREVARALGVSASYLAKILQSLAKAGMLISVRGVGGGFTLAADPSTITIRQVIEAVQGPIMLNQCLLRTGVCENSDMCVLHSALKDVQSKAVELFDEWTIGKLAERAQNTEKEASLPACHADSEGLSERK